MYALCYYIVWSHARTVRPTLLYDVESFTMYTLHCYMVWRHGICRSYIAMWSGAVDYVNPAMVYAAEFMTI